MKSSLYLAVALLTSAVANAQTDTTLRSETDMAIVAMVDSSIGKAYVTNSEKLMTLTAETLTPADIFPALGTYRGNGNSAEEISITLDETNKGIVWVEGLPQGRFRALMKKAPSTYKIPAQKSENGKAIAEGTLHVDPATAQVTIVLGQSFNDREPTAVLTVANKKGSWRFTGVKAEVAMPVETPTSQQ